MYGGKHDANTVADHNLADTSRTQKQSEWCTMIVPVPYLALLISIALMLLVTIIVLMRRYHD